MSVKSCFKTSLSAGQHADNKVKNNHQDQYAIHDQVNPYIGFVFIIEILQSFKHVVYCKIIEIKYKTSRMNSRS